MSRVVIEGDPFSDPAAGFWSGRGLWPASWVDHPQRPRDRPTVAVFRLRFTLSEATDVRLHVSADNRYRLFCDGRALGRGPERGSPEAWYFETYALTLEPGDHTLVALSWWLHDVAPWAQMSIRPGFLCAAEAPWMEALSTGHAGWEVMLADGFEFPPVPSDVLAWHAVGNRLAVDGAAFPWRFETGDCAGDWTATSVVGPAHAMGVRDTNRYWSLTPAVLPPMLEVERPAGRLRHLDDREGRQAQVERTHHRTGEAEAWTAMLAGGQGLEIPAHTVRRAIIDADDYVCAYPLLAVEGGRGSAVRIEWAESLVLSADTSIAPGTQVALRHKGNRDDIDGRWFVGIGDAFRPAGGHREFTTLWWEAGRYLCVTVRTGDESLTITGLRLLETRYPLAMEGAFQASDARLEAITAPALRAMQMCSHETYMDCPYYEQLMYIGDTRLEMLVTHVLTADDRLPWKAVRTFARSRRLSGFTRSAFPSHTVQVIPPFSLWWVNMVHETWLWRDRDGCTAALLPAVRGVLDAFHALRRADGLLPAPPEWNFADWVPDWPGGIPPGGDTDPSALVNLQYILALDAKAALERGHGEPELAARDERLAAATLQAVLGTFWNEARGLLADDPGHSRYSEHVQCLALLTGRLPAGPVARLTDGLFGAGDLARTTIYFSHYYFETCRLLGRIDKLFERLALWDDLLRLGFKTTVESPEPSRSDCHAWGAHPLFHYYATLLGIRPAVPGFARVEIAPQLGPLTWADGSLPHPRGMITARVERVGDGLRARIVLPDGVDGEFRAGGRRWPLKAGAQAIESQGGSVIC